MNKIIAIMLSSILLLAGVGMLYANGGNYIQVYDNSIFSCQRELLIYDLDEECFNDCRNSCPTCCDSSCHQRCCDIDYSCFNNCPDCECQLNNCYENCSQTCLNGCYVDMSSCLGQCTEQCKYDCALPKNIGDITSTSYAFNLERCGQPATLSGTCHDFTVEPAINLGPCEYSPSNYRCELLLESFELCVYYDGSGIITVNGRDFNTADYPYGLCFLFHNSQEEDPDPRTFEQIPSSVTISADGEFNPGGFGIILERQCCWNCVKKSFPAAILYPKVDIESFNVEGGPQIIKDGKVLSAFEMSPGSQKVFLQVENRGFFTQNDARVRFEGLPQGVTVNITPETQTINAHNIGTYSANFTVDPNVPSGTYQVTMVAFSLNGVFDIITFEFVVP